MIPCLLTPCACVSQVMYGGENRLKGLPVRFGRLTQLQELDVSGCELETLPQSLSRCVSLIRLWLSNNRWRTTIFTVPSPSVCVQCGFCCWDLCVPMWCVKVNYWWTHRTPS